MQSGWQASQKYRLDAATSVYLHSQTRCLLQVICNCTWCIHITRWRYVWKITIAISSLLDKYMLEGSIEVEVKEVECCDECLADLLRALDQAKCNVVHAVFD